MAYALASPTAGQSLIMTSPNRGSMFGAFPTAASQYMPVTTSQYSMAAPPTTVMAAAPVTTMAAPVTTMAAPVSTVTPVSQAQSVFDRIDKNHDGVVTRQEFQQAMAAQQAQSVVTTVSAAPPVATTFTSRSVPVARDLLAMGHLIQETVTSREDLIRRGYLLPDTEREALLARQHEARPGALLGAHTVLSAGHAYGGSVMQTTTPATYGGTTHTTHTTHLTNPTTTHTTHAEGGHAGRTSHHAHVTGRSLGVEHASNNHRTETLEVSILHARNLQHMNMVGDHWYVVCEAKRPPGFPHGKTTKCTTQHIAKTPDPAWNELHHMEHWHHGDDLEFIVYDKGLLNSKTQGKCKLSHTNFYPNGWEGEIPLDCGHGAVLGVRVVPLGQQG